MTHLIQADRLVPLSDVLHHAGNGLCPARIAAQMLADVLKLLHETQPLSGPDTGAIWHDELLRQARCRTHELIDAIDTTMARLRALEHLNIEEAPHEGGRNEKSSADPGLA